MKIFNSVKDEEHLHDILHSIQSTISKILETITECCLLMRKHARHSFAGRRSSPAQPICTNAKFIGRSLNKGDKDKIDELVSSLSELKEELNQGFTRQTGIQVEVSREYEFILYESEN